LFEAELAFPTLRPPDRLPGNFRRLGVFRQGAGLLEEQRGHARESSSFAVSYKAEISGIIDRNFDGLHILVPYLFQSAYYVAWEALSSDLNQARRKRDRADKVTAELGNIAQLFATEAAKARAGESAAERSSTKREPRWQSYGPDPGDVS